MSVENNDESTMAGGVTGKGFLPGQTGNAGGRSKARAEFQRQFMMVVENLKVPYQEGKHKPRKLLPVVEALTNQLVKYANKGNAWAMKLFFDLAIGKHLDLMVSKPEGAKFIFEHRAALLNIKELLDGEGLTVAQINRIRKKAIAKAFPGRGFNGGKDDA